MAPESVKPANQATQANGPQDPTSVTPPPLTTPPTTAPTATVLPRPISPLARPVSSDENDATAMLIRDALNDNNDDNDDNDDLDEEEGEEEEEEEEDDDTDSMLSLERRLRRISADSTTSVESYEQYIPTPLDGGYGWVIVVASLCCNLIVDGIGYTFGVFLPDFAEYFDAPKSKVSLVGSCLNGVYLMAGPVVSALTNKFGCRRVAVAGAVVAGLSFLLSTFSTSVDMLILTYGVLGGFGLGMIYLPAIVSVGYYFEKKRALATGIAVCGSGIGTFVFAPLSEFLLEEMNWQNALMIIAALTFQAAVFAMLMRPLEPPKTKKVKQKRQPRAKNIIDRIKEQSKAKRNRTISETSYAWGSSQDTNAVLQRVMQAKLLREKRLQDTESELGSLPSVFFTRQQSRRESAAAGSRVHKLSLTDWGDVASFLGSPLGSVPRIVVQDDPLGASPLAASPQPQPHHHTPLAPVIEGSFKEMKDLAKESDEEEKEAEEGGDNQKVTSSNFAQMEELANESEKEEKEAKEGGDNQKVTSSNSAQKEI